MTWHEEKHQKFTCECGLRVSESHRARHQLTRWHRLYPGALRLRAEGKSFAAIARELNLSRVYIARLFQQVRETEEATK